MKKKDLVDGNFMIHNEDIYMIINVRNAYDSGLRDRGDSHSNDELAYDLLNLLTLRVWDGICERSGVTIDAQNLDKDIVIEFLLSKEADINLKLATLNKKQSIINISKTLVENKYDEKGVKTIIKHYK